MDGSAESTGNDSESPPVTWDTFAADVEDYAKDPEFLLSVTGSHFVEQFLYDLAVVISEPGLSDSDSRPIDYLPFCQSELHWMREIYSQTRESFAFRDVLFSHGRDVALVPRFRLWLIGEPGGPYEGQAAALVREWKESHPERNRHSPG